MKKLQAPSEKNFGVTFSIIGFIIFIYILIYQNNINLIVFGISLVLLILSFTVPKLLRIPNILWFKFGILLSIFMTPLILGFIFFLILGPISLLRKISQINIKSSNSSWKKTDKEVKVDFTKQY